MGTEVIQLVNNIGSKEKNVPESSVKSSIGVFTRQQSSIRKVSRQVRNEVCTKIMDIGKSIFNSAQTLGRLQRLCYPKGRNRKQKVPFQ